MKNRIKQLWALSAAEWWTLLSSLVILPLIALALHLKGYKWTRAYLQKRIPAGTNRHTRENSPENSHALKTAHSVSRVVSAAANHGPYRANCLKRSLTVWWLLQRRGIKAELHIGVNTDDKDFNAHAWVEYMGDTLVEAEDLKGRFSSFDSD